LVYYDLNDCVSWNGSENFIYDEFTPQYPGTLDCAEVSASIIFRNEPMENSHSCTPGVNDTPAMCVSSLDACAFDTESDKILTFRTMIEPDSSEAVVINALSFFQKAPATFDWIAGPEGLNNYPTLYGVRVLKNNEEIYFVEDIATALEWQSDTLFFDDTLSDFVVDEFTVLTVEILAYCLVGNGAPVSAFDIDEIKLFGICEPETPAAREVVGYVTHAINATEISATDIVLKQSDYYQLAESDDLGMFAFQDVPYQSNNELFASKDGDDLQGVSTLDLLKIKRHILGLEPFDIADKIIAADINNDELVSAIDLVELRKLILGIYPGFPQNESWKFYNAQYDIENCMPWDMIESITLATSYENDYVPNFKGIKIGDVDGSYVSDFGNPTIDTRSNLTTKLNYEIIENLIHFRSTNFEDILGLQIQLNVSGSNFEKIIPGVLPIASYHYNIEGSNLSISWDAEEIIDVDESDVLFTLVCSLAADKLSLDQSNMQNESYSGAALEVNQIDLSARTDQASKNLLSSLSIYPNPFITDANILFNAPEAGLVSVRVLDLFGKQQINAVYDVQQGENVIKLDAAALAGVGTYIIDLEYNGERHYTKVVLGK